MRAIHRFTLIALLIAPVARGDDEQLRRAEQLQRNSPSAARALGIFEMRRAAGLKAEPPRGAGDFEKPSPGRDAWAEAVAWRMIPTAAAGRSGFDATLDAWVKAKGKSPWVGVFRLYSASVAGDRAALISAAAAMTDVPGAFPSVAAEQAHFELLKELGVDENRAGLEVLSHRSYAPLHGLLELDRALTREVTTLSGTSRAADAEALRNCRDRLRQAWLDASRHLVERLFALHVLGREQEVEAVLFASRKLPYLTDAGELGRALARVDKGQAWALLIGPLLESEVRVIAAPPALPAAVVGAAAAAELTVEAKGKSVRAGVSTYDGAVRVRAGGLELTCDQLAVLGESATAARILSAAGNVTIRGGGFDVIRADNATLHLDTGTYALGGNVRLTRGERTIKLRAATVGRSGDLRDAVSLLDDFEAAADEGAKVALLGRVAEVYADEELPAGVRYWLALSLARPHLTWARAEGAGGFELSAEGFLREDAVRAVGGAGSRVEGMLQKDLPVRVTCAVKDVGHADVVRARRLLESVGEGEFAGRAREWRGRLGVGK